MGTAIRFTASGSNQMVYNSPPQLTGAWALLIVVRIMVTADNTWQSFIENETSGGAARPSLGRHSTGNIYGSNESAASQGGAAIADSDGWIVVCASRPAGASQTVSLHKLVVGGSRTSGSGDVTLSNSGSYASGNLRIGGNDDFADIEVACAAIFDKTLSTTDLDGINTAKTSQSILDLAPVWMVDASSGLITDEVGAVDRTSVTGTAAGSSDPTGWTYLGAAATSIPFLVMAPPAAA